MADEANEQPKPRRKKKPKKDKIISTTGLVGFMIVNCFLVVVGASLILGGIIVKYGSEKLETEMEPLYALMTDSVDEAHMPEFGKYQLMTNRTAMGFIITGALLLPISILGCISSFCQIRLLLILYGFLVGCIMVCEAGFLILLFSMNKEMKVSMKNPLKINLKHHYAGAGKSDVTSNGWNYIMTKFQCCGIENYTEFQYAKSWDRRTKINGMHFLKAIPDSCCVHEVGRFDSRELKEIKDQNCTLNPTSQNSFINTPCWPLITLRLNEHNGLMMGIGICVMAFEILVLTISLIEANAGTFTKETGLIKCRIGSWESLKKYVTDGCNKYLPVQTYSKGSRKVNQHGLETLL